METYHNTENWPTNEIYRDENNHIINSGIVKGEIFQNDKGGYNSHLGISSRTFQINKNSLSTGSLIYPMK